MRNDTTKERDKDGERGGGGRGVDVSAYMPQKAEKTENRDPKGGKGKTTPLPRIPCTAHRLDTELCVCEPCTKPPISNKVSVSLSVPLVQGPVQAAAIAAGTKGNKPKATTATVALIDTGAKGHDFISGELADELASHGAQIVSAKGSVKTALNGEEIRVLDSAIVVNYNFTNEETKQLETITITPVILDDLRCPLIIGLDTIHEHGLLCKQIPELCAKLCRPVSTTTTRPSGRKGGRATECENSALPTTHLQKQRTPAGSDQPTCRTVKAGRDGEWDGCELCEIGLSSRDLFGERDDSESDSENHPDNISDLLPSSRDAGGSVEQVSEMVDKIIFEGETALQERLRALCTVYGDQGLFSRTVRKQAAHVPAMRLEVDAEKFRQAGSKSRSPRPQSQEKLAELKRMVTELLKLGVIRASTADTVSQVLLVVRKGTSKLRFCIDYRALNEATQVPEAWPIPNIKTMLERLGSKKPKFFGVMDLTSGYHQAPLAESAKRWTAFVTAFGVYEWNRVAMGLTGAPSYFQRVMMTDVLGELLMSAVEVYLDDFIVFGANEEEFLENVEKTFIRFVKAGITLNPDKCRSDWKRSSMWDIRSTRQGYISSGKKLILYSTW